MVQEKPMKRKAPAFLAACALVAGAAVFAQQGQQPKPAVAHTHLKVGDKAPDFTLRDQNFQPVTLSEFRGNKNVVLAFYVLAFTGG